MRTFYPRIKPYATHWLEVGDGQQLYVEEVGVPEGIPVLFVHGGPGAGCTENDRRFFDPEKYRIILFDQRGSGRSKPHATVENNTTQHLLADMETLRRFLGVKQWLLFGGSWGSTLSLLYAQAHPEHVLGFILRGIFLCRDRDVRWFYQSGASRVFPNHWQDFLAPIPAKERFDMLAAYHKRLVGDNEIERMGVAKAWSIWEGRCATLHQNPALVEHLGCPHTALAMARIEAHYFIHQAFLTDNQILDNMAAIAHLPATIIHGRYDMVCPLDQAYALYNAWPDANLVVVRDAGHASSEPGTLAALLEATDVMAKKFEGQFFE